MISISSNAIAVDIYANIGAGGGDIQGSLNQMQIKSGTVQGYQVADGAIQTAKLSNAAVTADKIQDGVISASKLASASVTDNAIGYATINPNKLAQAGASLNQVLSWNGGGWVPATPSTSGADASTTTKGIIQLAGDLAGTAAAPSIANNAITSAKIVDATIATADLANNAITSAKIADGTVATADLADGAITSAKLNTMSATNGQILKFNGTNWAPATEAATSNWLVNGNTNATTASFLGTTNDVAMRIRSNNIPMLEFGRRQTLGLTQSYADYTNDDQPLVHLNGNGTTSALQFAASAANFYKPMFFTTADGNFRLKGSAAGTDFFEIGSSGTGNAGRLDFIVGDDGDEPIVFSKFNYNTSSSVEMMRMQGTGLDNTVRVGVNTNGNIANSTMQVNGSVSYAITNVSSSITLNDTHYTVILGNGNLTITLPSASTCTGRVYVVKNPSNQDKNVTGFKDSAGDNASIIPKKAVTILQSDGTNWQQIN